MYTYVVSPFSSVLSLATSPVIRKLPLRQGSEPPACCDMSRARDSSPYPRLVNATHEITSFQGSDLGGDEENGDRSPLLLTAPEVPGNVRYLAIYRDAAARSRHLSSNLFFITCAISPDQMVSVTRLTAPSCAPHCPGLEI
ncbi:hypothetical protein ElyMa_003509700 [Elysia marginata]|uniref:UDENN domain-containing protein n=1 Tax=Elysia marginata TaxID=1093978 RepID=A0AAV4EEZ6_9GAST|nr:hypothetical protein ElyMa_003509700 [Elysia marginata]